jgi:hAT family C-terminal dimerisation region
MFPTVYAVAMDYLPIQASAVPCERVFSSSSETYTKKRNRLSPVLMEALQIVKFILKKERLNFTKGWAASQQDMEYALLRETASDGSFTLNTSGASGDNSNHDALLNAIAVQECDDIDNAAIIYGILH